MIAPVIAIEKAFAAKDYGKLVEKHGVDVNGKPYTTWVLPEDAKQASLFHGEDAGKANPKGERGYLDHLDKGTQQHMVKPLVDLMKKTNPELADRLAHKYESYRFDRDTLELDVKHDYEMAWYMKKMKAEPENAQDWQKEYNQKTDSMVRQINNRKMAMLKVKKGQQVSYYGKPAVVSDFSRRGFPVVKTESGEVKALWEEIN